MELAYQAQLLGKAGSRRVIRDRPGAIVEDVEAIKPAEAKRQPQPGDDELRALRPQLS